MKTPLCSKIRLPLESITNIQTKRKCAQSDLRKLIPVGRQVKRHRAWNIMKVYKRGGKGKGQHRKFQAYKTVTLVVSNGGGETLFSLEERVSFAVIQNYLIEII